MKALVLLSGGVDSTTCLGMAVKKHGNNNVIGLCITYGQKHTKELESAKAVADYYQVEWLYMDLASMFAWSDSSLLSHSGQDIPKESYADQLLKTDGKPVSTYVPFRNGLFLSTAASIAISKGCEIIYYGAHSDDAAGNAYPDCSKAFHDAMNQAIWEGSGHIVNIQAPFISMSKKDVVKTGLSLDVPYQLTWSCYEGGNVPCGKCATCIDRQAAFRANGVEDPILKNC